MPARRVGADPPQARADWGPAIAAVLALHRQGRLDEAEPRYRQLLRRLPDHAGLTHFHGVLLYQRQRVDEALALVRRSIALDPRVGAWHNNLGNMLLDQQQHAEAALAYQRCLALEPDNTEVCNNLACLLRQHGRLDEAESLLREAIRRVPHYGDAHANLAVVLAQQGRLDEAEQAGARATALQPDNPRARRLLGQLYARRGRPDLAAQLFRSWLDRCPGDPQAQHLLAAVTGENVPARAGDAFVVQVFDRFAASFDAKLAQLAYRAPALCADLLRQQLGPPDGQRAVLDAGCGTGLCGPLLRPFADTLTGVDLSPGMLARARQRGVYDELVQAELGAWLAGCTGRFDVVVSADTLCYFGPLQPVLSAARRAVRAGGWLVFTVEVLSTPAAEGHRLLHHGRYAHDPEAIATWLVQAGWTPAAQAPVVLRQEAGQPVAGWLVSARAAAA